ncbi:DEAD/DEAH box helicase [Sinorhizobium meliloti]|uniref:DEAD/DEAH box helicase n=1 Tax=Rhizobium meliloti TaxID=382 RepID=UPI001296D896|nr:DEAD/DEAH box helicase [Sinorhizobium meliloti]MQW47445.1 DEAD/DEAH box helicase [Sinorhizobium meliloti]
MKPFATLSEIRRRSAEAIISQSGIRDTHLVDHLRRVFNADTAAAGGLLQQPIIEGAHPFVPAAVNMAGVPAKVLHPRFVEAIDGLAEGSDYRFPKTRRPFRHQLEAWEHLSRQGDPQSVLVTSGTGSGKTECFLFPILSDLVSQATSGNGKIEGVQAIMLYPLNALIESQRERLSAWTRPFGGSIRYCLYNGDLPNSQPSSLQRVTPEQQIDREQLRSSPPPILVTNVTMLEYMLARAEDQPIIEKSKGKLKWIVLDEAHSLVGAAAAEIALLLRRVLLAFDCKPEEVHFVATSATIGSGDDIQNQLRRFLADVAGIADANVHVVEGARQLPARPASRAKLPVPERLEQMNGNELFDALAADEVAWDFVAKKLFDRPQTLSAMESVAKRLGLDAEGFMTLLANAKRTNQETGEPENLAPMRIHGFERAVPGIWSCVNPTCKNSPTGWGFGEVFIDPRDECPACSAPVLEIISCQECGEVVLEAHDDTTNNRIRSTRRGGDSDEFEFEALRDQDDPEVGDDAQDEEEAIDLAFPELRRTILLRPEGASGLRPLHLSTKDWQTQTVKADDTVTVAYDEKADFCPCCGKTSTRGVDSLLRPVRFGAPFMIANAAPILLEGVDPGPTNKPVPSQGRRLLSFTDSRQGTARMSAKMQAEAERNFVRSFVYHSVQHSISTSTRVDTAALKEEIAGLEAVLAATPIPAVQNILASKRTELAAAGAERLEGLPWNEMVSRLSEREEVDRWVKEVWSPREPRLFSSSVELAEFLLLRELARRPRKALSLETLGMARLRFPAIDAQQSLPAPFARRGKTIDDWRSFLYAITTYFMRGNAAVVVQPDLMHWITPRAKTKGLLSPGAEKLRDRRKLAWPGVPRNLAVLSTPQALLLNGLSLDISLAEHRADIEDCFDRAWHNLQPVLGDDPSKPALDLRKSFVAPVVEGFVCPTTRRVLNTAPFGTSPFAQGTQRSKPSPVERISLPRHPKPLLGDVDPVAARSTIIGWLEESAEVASLRELGIWNNISDRVALFAEYARSAEHSAQQESSVLRAYEQKFKDGEVNILNCSTTMEMGVDIGSVSTVMMTNVPPSAASYKQRVGRAGRRGQSFSLAFTFCRDRPLDREAFVSPISYLDRKLAAPRVALSSRPIVQRHVNAFLLRRFMIGRGGDPIRMTIGSFLGFPAVVGERRLVLEQRPVGHFKVWLQAPTTVDLVEAELERLVRHSVLEGEKVMIEACLNAVTDLEGTFLSEWEGLQALAKDEGVKGAGRSRMGMELQRMCDEFLLSALADRGFLPGHGFPTGVVTFLPHRSRSDQPIDGRRTTRLSGPQRSLDLAIRDYAPGSEIVLDGLVHKSAGVLLNWKRPATEENIRDVQSLKFHWNCKRCGTSDSSRARLTACPACAGPVNSGQYLRPSGFSVDARDKAHAETDMISYVAPEEPSVSVRAAPWVSLPIPELGRLRSTREGAVYYSNRGSTKNGYALCLHCGRAAPDHPVLDTGEVDQTTPSPLSGHAPLRWKKDENSLVCEGNTNAWSVRRNLELGYEITTDVFEIQPSAPLSKAAATALAIAIREGTARILGIEADEMGFATKTSEGFLGGRAASLLVFDKAAGGAGFAASIPGHLSRVLYEATEVLDCSNAGCTSGCAACVLVRDAPFEPGSLDRIGALRFVRNHLSFDLELSQEDWISKDSTISTSVLDEVERALRESQKPNLQIYLPAETDAGELSAWPLISVLDRWRLHGHTIGFVVSDEFMKASDTAGRLALYDLGKRFATSTTPFPLFVGPIPAAGNGSKIGAAVSSNGVSMVWASRDDRPWLPGDMWGGPVERPIVRGSVDLPRDIRPLDETVLLPSPGSKYETITNELDRPSSLFGTAMANRIRGLVAPLGVAKGQKVISIRYSDQYVRSPLVAKLFIDTVADLVKGSAPTIELLTSPPAPRNNLQYRVFDDWRDGPEAEQSIRAYAQEKGLTLAVQFAQIPHGRYMDVTFEGGLKVTLVFDQGFGAWRTTASGGNIRHDFAAPLARQANALARLSIPVARSGHGPTYIVASRTK